MKRCHRSNRVRLILEHIHGTLASESKIELESHLLTCNHCSETLRRLQQGDRFARMIPETPPSPEAWSRIERTFDDSARYSSKRLQWNAAGVRTAAIAIVVLSIMAVAWIVKPAKDTGSFSLDHRKYKKVQLSSMAENTEPHIVTEGIVSEIAIDNEDGDYRIKLKENLENSAPFVICEVLRPSSIPLPEVGRRIRVYGVSRFDSKPGHQWYEVHPVFEIEAVH